MSRIIVPVPCHFAASNEVCKTTVARMHEALTAAQPSDLLLLSGDVPYAPGGPTLGALMRDWLLQRDIGAESVCLIRGGVGTFSEARTTCEVAPHLATQEIILISSSWYLFAGKTIWQRRAKENGVKISFVSVPRTGGIRTRVLYGVLGFVVRVAIVLGLEKPLERFFTSAEVHRRAGFTFDGCA